MDILDDIGVNKLSAKVFFLKSELMVHSSYSLTQNHTVKE